MFFTKKYGFLIIKRSGVMVWDEKQLLGEISFSPASLRNMEVVDKKLFSEGLLAGLQRLLPVSNRLLILLCDEIVFSKLAGNGDYATEMSNFKSLIPFEAGTVEAKMVDIDGQRYLVGVNLSFLSTLKEALEQGKYKVVATLPMIVFHRKGEVAEVSLEFLQDVMSHQKLFKALSF